MPDHLTSQGMIFRLKTHGSKKCPRFFVYESIMYFNFLSYRPGSSFQRHSEAGRAACNLGARGDHRVGEDERSLRGSQYRNLQYP